MTDFKQVSAVYIYLQFCQSWYSVSCIWFLTYAHMGRSRLVHHKILICYSCVCNNIQGLFCSFQIITVVCLFWHFLFKIQSVPGVKVTTSGFNSRADSESKMSYTHGSNSQRFRSYEFLSSSSSYICHGVGPLVDPFRSHVSRSLFKGLPWFLLPVGE